jgi:glutaredoxin
VRRARVTELAVAAASADEADGRWIRVYGTSWCPHCKRAKAWLDQHGYAYQDLDVEARPESGRVLRSLNPRGSVPTIDVDGEVLLGFSPEGLDAAIQSALRRRSASGR